MNFERGRVAKQQHACTIFIDIIDKKDPIDIETNQDVALTDTKCTRNVQKINGFSKQTAAYCTCNGIIMHAYDNFLFKDSHDLGLRKMCKLLLVFLSFKL